MGNNLVRRDSAAVGLHKITQTLAATTCLKDVKDVADTAAAMLVHAKRAKAGLHTQNTYALVKLLAERRMGELLEQTERLRGRPAKGSQLKRLSEIGVDYNESHRWRALTKITPAELDAMREDCDRMYRELTTAYVTRWIKPPEAVRPWERHWDDRPDEKEVFDAINWLYQTLVPFARPDADKAREAVGRDGGYLNEHDVERLLTELRRAWTFVCRCIGDVHAACGRPDDRLKRQQLALAKTLVRVRAERALEDEDELERQAAAHVHGYRRSA